jgi:hypothetical protein
MLIKTKDRNPIFENILSRYGTRTKNRCSNVTREDVKPRWGLGFVGNTSFSIDMFSLREKFCANNVANDLPDKVFISIERMQTCGDVKPLRGLDFERNTSFSIDMFSLRERFCANNVTNDLPDRAFISIERMQTCGNPLRRRRFISIEKKCNTTADVRRTFISIERLQAYGNPLRRRRFISIDKTCDTTANVHRTFISIEQMQTYSNSLRHRRCISIKKTYNQQPNPRRGFTLNH